MGFYDASKKAALQNNAVLPVLLLNTVFSTLIFSPFILDSAIGANWFAGNSLDTFDGSLLFAHLLVLSKSLIVLGSWICGYFGLKHLPITIVGPINATRPVLVLLGAMIVFGERLNGYQWAGVILSILSLFLLSLSGKKEQVDFAKNKWIWLIALAAVLGAVSGLYDKYIMNRLKPMFVQGWYNFYQMIFMSVICLFLWYPRRKSTTPFYWSWAIPLISIFISLADFAYLSALKCPDSMISVTSLIRRGSVLVSFACGALIFREKNLKSKALDLVFILAGMVLIWIGSRQM